MNESFQKYDLNSISNAGEINKNLNTINSIEKNEFIEIINKFSSKVNHVNFILIIRIIMTIIISFILIIYILIIHLKNNFIKTSETIILANNYNFQIRDLMLNIYSRLLIIYYEFNEITLDKFNTLEEHQNILSTFSYSIKEKYHNFTHFFFDYNLKFGNYFNIIFNEKKFYKIRKFWEEVEYMSTFSEELDIIIHHIYCINLFSNNNGIIDDISNFLFFNSKKKYNVKIKTTFIKLLYYFSKNYELTYKNIYNEIHEEIKFSYKKFYYSEMINFLLLEIFVLLFYIIFFISVIIYLFYANQIIIKNIIFLFLDFSEKAYDYYKIENNNLIIWKLLEFKNLIDDFNLEKLQDYKININRINIRQIINLDKSYYNENELGIISNKNNVKVIKKNKSSKNISFKFKSSKKITN